MDQDKISIIIPVYNVIQYLQKAVDSILKQNYANMEIILVDDGSTDGSEILCDALEYLDGRIKTIHISNSGPAVARNVGLDAAQGKYIYFMDSDDYLECNLFKTILPFLKQGYELVVFNYRKVDSDDNFLLQSEFESGIFSFEEIEQKIRFILEKVLKYRIGWEPWNRVYVREIIEKNHIRFGNENYAEDLYFFLCYIGCINNIFSLDAVLYNYKIHANSLMNLSKRNPLANLNKVNNLSCQLKEFYESTDACFKLRNYYPLIHYFFLKQHIDELRKFGCSQKDIGKYIRTGMDKSELCLKYFRQFIVDVGEYALVMDKPTLIQVRHILKYYCDGNMVLYRIRSKILRLQEKCNLYGEK